MSEPAKKKPRITEDLHTLGRILHQPNTPKQRTSNKEGSASAGANRIYVRTPGSAAAATPTARTPTASARTRKVGSARRGAPTTPHAIRALQQRRNAVLASGGNRRRRSGLMQRETPRDDLRALSRVLAKKSTRAPSPAEPTPRRRRSSLVDQDDSPAVGQAPRLSLPPNALDDDSFHEQPPRLSYALDDDEDEVEQRRRAALGRDRQSLTSFIDPSLIDLNEYGPGEYEDVTEQRRQMLDGDLSIHVDGVDDDGETAELRAMLEARRQSGEGGDLTQITDGEPTFLFRIPERSRLSLAPPVPRTPEGQTADYGDDEVQGYEDVDEDVEDDAAQAGDEVGFDDDDDDDDENVPFEIEGLDDEMEHNVPLRETSVPLPDDQARADAATTTKTKAPYKRLPKEVKISHFGIEYPSFPMPVIKKLASTFSRQYGGSGKLSKETLLALQQASDWYFEQVSEDLADYATHAGRKTIEEADMVTLMKRQRVLNQNTTLFSLASKYLPRELLQEVRMPPQQVKGKKRKRVAKRRMETIAEDEEDDS